MFGIGGIIGSLIGKGRNNEIDPLEALKDFNKQEALKKFYDTKEKIETDNKSAKFNGVIDSHTKQVNAMTELSRKITV